MTTIIRRTRRRLASPLSAIGATILLVVPAVWLLTTVWIKGGPQPMHEIVIALPAPQVRAVAGQHR